MPIHSKQRLFEASVTVYLCKQHIAQYCGDSNKRIRVSKSHRAKEKDRISMFGPNKVNCASPCQILGMWGVDLPSIVGG